MIRLIKIISLVFFLVSCKQVKKDSIEKQIARNIKNGKIINQNNSLYMKKATNAFIWGILVSILFSCGNESSNKDNGNFTISEKENLYTTKSPILFKASIKKDEVITVRNRPDFNADSIGFFRGNALIEIIEMNSRFDSLHVGNKTIYGQWLKINFAFKRSMLDTLAYVFSEKTNYILNTEKEIQLRDTIIVKNEKEFIDALGSNRMLRIKVDTLDFDSYFEKTNQKTNVFDRYLTIKNYSNFILKGDTKKVHFIVNKPYLDVVTFQNCTNFLVDNFSFYHTTGYDCSGGVASIIDSKKGTFLNCEFNGSGTIGADIITSKNIEFENCRFFNTSMQAVALSGLSRVKINNSFFYDNSGVIIKQQENAKISAKQILEIENSYILNNNAQLLFETLGAHYSHFALRFNNSIIYNNRFSYGVVGHLDISNENAFGLEIDSSTFQKNYFIDEAYENDYRFIYVERENEEKDIDYSIIINESTIDDSEMIGFDVEGMRNTLIKKSAINGTVFDEPYPNTKINDTEITISELISKNALTNEVYEKIQGLDVSEDELFNHNIYELYVKDSLNFFYRPCDLSEVYLSFKKDSIFKDTGGGYDSYKSDEFKRKNNTFLFTSNYYDPVELEDKKIEFELKYLNANKKLWLVRENTNFKLYVDSLSLRKYDEKIDPCENCFSEEECKKIGGILSRNYKYWIGKYKIRKINTLDSTSITLKAVLNKRYSKLIDLSSPDDTINVNVDYITKDTLKLNYKKGDIKNSLHFFRNSTTYNNIENDTLFKYVIEEKQLE